VPNQTNWVSLTQFFKSHLNLTSRILFLNRKPISILLRSFVCSRMRQLRCSSRQQKFSLRSCLLSLSTTELCYIVLLTRPPRLITVKDFRFFWLAQLDRIRDQIEALKLLDIHPTFGEYSHQFKVARRPSQKTIIKKRPRENEDKGIPPLLCTGCGRKSHVVAACFFRASPKEDCNTLP
jgi:hypothetical protein